MYIYEITGTTSYHCIQCTSEEAEAYKAPQWFVSETPIVWATHRIVNGVLEEIPVEPVTPPQPTLEQFKESKRLQMKMQRDTLELSGFPYLGKVFDSDDKAFKRLSIAIQAATTSITTGNKISFEWTTADNTNITLNEEELMGLPVALAMYANELHERYRELNVAIDSCASKEELEAIQWTES